MNFVTKQIKTQDLAEYLQECRRHSGLSIADATVLSGIQPKFIEALEEGRLKDLPASVYVRGFLKSLARVYRVSSQPLLEQYAAEQTLQTNAQVDGVGATQLPREKVLIPRFVLSPRTITIMSIGVLGLISFGYLYFQVSSLRRPPALEIFSPVSDSTVNSSLLLVRGKTEAGAVVSINNQPVVADTEGNFQENLSLGIGANQLVIKAVNKFDQETVLTRSIFFWQKEVAGSFAATLADETIPRVSLEVVMEDEAAWILLEADGLEQYAGTMLPNARRTINARSSVIMSTGNAGATRVVLNGKDLGVLGKPGEVLRDIEFTPSL